MTGSKIELTEKLDFSVDIGDAFPLHELRKSADTSSVYCFLKIPRKQFPLGIKCLDGWGFNYLDFSTNRQRDKSDVRKALVSLIDGMSHSLSGKVLSH